MASQTIAITITTPQGVTVAEALDLFCNHHGYSHQALQGETKLNFAKRIIAQLVQTNIATERLAQSRASSDTIELAKPPIIVE